jgi:membrane fusion protein (multidrug efflux system)
MPPQGPPEVLCVRAVVEEVSNSYELIGQTVAEDSVSVVPMVEGYLIKQGFDEGSMVKKGDLLFEIDPRPYEAQVKNAEGQVASARAQLINANIEYNRYTTLLKETATSQKSQDYAAMQKGAAEGQLLIAAAALDTAKINLGYTKLTAPFDGKISVCPTSVGNLVGQPGNRQALTSIMKLDPMKVECNVPETALAFINEKYGSFDDITKFITPRIILPNGTVYQSDGVIYFTDNQVTANTGTFKLRSRFPNPKTELLPNEYVKVILTINKKRPMTLIPQTAVTEDMTGSVVMTVKDGKADRRNVKTGQTHGPSIEILSGIENGDWVVTEGLIKIRHGMPVSAKLAPPAAATK